MAHLFGVFTHAATAIGPLLELTADHSRVSAVDNRWGYGLGFTHGGETLLQRRPQVKDQAIDLARVASEVRTTAFVAHVRQAAVGAVDADNTQPFRFGPWLFGQVGQLPGGAAALEPLRAQLPDSLARNIAGETEAELFFHLFLARLYDTGANPRHWAVDPLAVARALGHTLTAWRVVARQVGDNHAPDVAAVLTHGQALFAVSYGRPLWYAALRSTPKDHVDIGLVVEGETGEARLGVPGAVVLVDGDEAPRGGRFRALPSGTLLRVDRDLRFGWSPAEV